MWGLRLQGSIELRVARAGELSGVIEWPVDADYATHRQYAADAGEHGLHFGPRHDVAGVGAEHGVERAWRPFAIHVQRQRRQDVGQLRLLLPRDDAWVVLRHIAGLPDEKRQRRAEEHRVLAGAAADFQDAPAIREGVAQDREDGLAVPLAGGGKLSAHAGIMPVEAWQ